MLFSKNKLNAHVLKVLHYHCIALSQLIENNIHNLPTAVLTTKYYQMVDIGERSVLYYIIYIIYYYIAVASQCCCIIAVTIFLCCLDGEIYDLHKTPNISNRDNLIRKYYQVVDIGGAVSAAVSFSPCRPALY